MVRAILFGAALCLTSLCGAAQAQARVLRVPAKWATIDAAVAAAHDGDEILVGPGAFCGATIDKRLTLRGQGHPRIIGCDSGPTVVAGGRVGFNLPGNAGVNPASGSEIRGFVFDGKGVSSANLTPLSFGVFARFARSVVVVDNQFEGTAQAITNSAGDRWRIEHNRIVGLTVLDCTSLCTGGDGIVISVTGSLAAPGGNGAPANRPEDNLILGNTIEGTPPDGFSTFSMAGVLLLAADYTTVLGNDVRIRDNPSATSVGQGILVSNTCCGDPTQLLPGSRHTVLAFNDTRQSEVGIVVEGTGGANTLGLVLIKNRGELQIESSPLQLLTAVPDGALAANAAPGPNLQSRVSPVRAQPTL